MGGPNSFLPSKREPQQNTILLWLSLSNKFCLLIESIPSTVI